MAMKLGSRRALGALALGCVLTATALVAQDKITDGLQIEGIRLSNTSGRVRLHDISASKVDLAHDGRVTLLRDMRAELRQKDAPPDAPTIRTRAPRAEIAVGGRNIEYPEGTRPEAPVAEALRTLDAKPIQDRPKGDFILLREDSPDGEPVRVEFEDRGGIQAGRLTWSEEAQRLMTADGFRQSGKQGDGSEVVVTADAFCVDRDFREWVYYSWNASNPITIEFKAPQPGAEGTKP